MVERTVAAGLGAALALYGTNLLAAYPFDTRRPGYLAVAGALPVRFQDETSPVPHPAQPMTAASNEPEVPAPAAVPAAASVRPAPPTPPPTEPPPNEAAKPPAAASGPDAKPPQGLLWDSGPPKVRPEDLLPYFQAPGTAERPDGATFVLPPQPPLRSTSDLPVSSATYTQSLH